MYNKTKLREDRTMKKPNLYIILVCLFVSTGWASYTYEVYTYSLENKHLFNEESILVDQQGGMDYLFLDDSSFALVQGTSIFEQGLGGIGHIELYDASSLEMSDGELVTLAINSNAKATLTGGWIFQIQSYQRATTVIPGNPPQVIPNPHITIECLDHFYDTNTKLLTGHWLDDGTAFSIQLVDVHGYSPAIQNIQFIPEPVTLSLLGLGILLLRRRAS
jgi:hypothetical protein